MPKLTLALLCGGSSSEREVSLHGGDQVYGALDKTKYEVLRYDPRSDLPKLVADAGRIDAALIILHGRFGEDGTIQGMLDLLDIPYQGSGVLGSAVAMNKPLSKQLYERAGLPVPAYITVEREDTPDVAQVIARLGLPLVVKPALGGSSVGMSCVESEEQFEPAIETAFEHDDAVLLETRVKGVEITAAVIGNRDLQALPLVEIIPDSAHAFFDYEAKYTAGITQEICPARIDDALTQTAQTYAIMAHRALCCEGYSRTDMILSGRELFVLETNTIPGMTRTSLLPQAAAAAGMNFSQLLDRLIELSIEARSGTFKNRG